MQCKMARIALALGVRDLAKLAKLSTATVARFEGGQTLKPSTVKSMQDALEKAGVEFIDEGQTSGAGGPGVRLARRKAKGKR